MFTSTCGSCGAQTRYSESAIPSTGLATRCARCGAMMTVTAPANDIIDLPAPKTKERREELPDLPTPVGPKSRRADLPDLLTPVGPSSRKASATDLLTPVGPTSQKNLPDLLTPVGPT